MNRKTKIIVGIALIFISLIIGRVGISHSQPEKSNSIAEFEPTPIVIDIPECNSYGWLTCYDKSGKELVQYYGEISITNDGTDGKLKDIKITIPYVVE